MDPVPLCLLVDDSAPLVHVYKAHAASTKDGRPLAETVPNAFLDRFCDLVSGYGVKGKFSIVPAPAGKGDITRGIPGHGRDELACWLNTVRRRLAPLFDFSPEMVSHDRALDLATGEYSIHEGDWSHLQDRGTLAPYIAYALRLLREAGFDANGVTSPWNFGEKVESEYIAAIMDAQREVFNRTVSWYFLHCLPGKPGARPWVAGRRNQNVLVSIPGTVQDHFWQTIDSPRTDGAFLSAVADACLTGDGAGGQIVEVIESGGWPILVTHWQSLYSNGLETGLKALDLVARRVESRLAGRARWSTCMELAGLTLAQSGD